MARESWLLNNLNLRKKFPTIDYRVHMILNKTFVPMSFRDESYSLVCDLANRHEKVYVGLSGGYDSEYVAQCFIDMQQKFFPIIASYNGNEAERDFAMRFCQKHKLDPVILKLSNEDLIKIFYHDVLQPFNGSAIYSLGNLAAARYAAMHGTVYVQADNFYSDEGNIKEYNLFVGEWEDYASLLHPQLEVIQFMKHTPAMAYASLKATEVESGEWQTVKARIYDVSFREKMRPTYDKKVQDFMRAVYFGRRLPNCRHYFGTKEEFLERLIPNRT
jgi:hypothetical protein